MPRPSPDLAALELAPRSWPPLRTLESCCAGSSHPWDLFPNRHLPRKNGERKDGKWALEPWLENHPRCSGRGGCGAGAGGGRPRGQDTSVTGDRANRKAQVCAPETHGGAHRAPCPRGRRMARTHPHLCAPRRANPMSMWRADLQKNSFHRPLRRATSRWRGHCRFERWKWKCHLGLTGKTGSTVPSACC